MDHGYEMKPITEPLPADVSALLDRLESVLQLEILIALRDSPEPLTPPQLIRRTGGTFEQVTHCLDTLVHQGFAIERDDRRVRCFSYRSGIDDDSVEILAELYVCGKVQVVAQLLS